MIVAPRKRVFLTIAVSVALANVRPGAESVMRPHGSTFALTHVRLVDGTGAPARDDQTIVVEAGRVAAVTPSSGSKPPAAEIIDLRGRTVMPGLVGMHDHLFYEMAPPGSRSTVIRAQRAFARLYLAAGVTTIRTAGTADFDGDLRLKEGIDAGKESGPRIHLTSPYLTAVTAEPDPERIAAIVRNYAGRGATWFKAYTGLRRSELAAAVNAAHQLGVRVTGHLCAVGFRDAVALGIDNVEHGLVFDTEFYSGKQPDVCPDQNAVFVEIVRMDASDVRIGRTMDDLIRRGVPITSTLAIIESFTGSDVVFDARVRPLLASRLRDTYEDAARRWGDRNNPVNRLFAAALRKEMALGRAFVALGGKLVAGVDPTGWGGVLAGLGDQRQLELLVESGFAPEEAIQIATSNGARVLRERDIGTIATGMRADLVVIDGDPIKHIADVRRVERVFKDGVAYDPAALMASVEGRVGAFDITESLTWPVIAMAVLLPVYAVVRRRRRRHAQSDQ